MSRTFDKMAVMIDERERALSVQKALNAALSQTNKTIIRVDTPDSLYENVCRIAVEYGNLKFAWIGVVDAEMGEVRLAASAGKTIQLRHTALSLDPEDEFGKSPIARAVRTNSPIITHDLSRGVEYLPSFEMPQGDEIGSVAIFPIRDGDRVAGDAMLQMLAQLLQTTLRQRDTLACLGGDEFGLLLEGCFLEQAYLTCKKST